MSTTTLAAPATAGLKHSSLLRDDVLDIIVVLEDFCTLLSDETDALKTFNFEKVDSLQAEKKSIAARYQGLVVAMGNRRAEIEDLDTTLREKFVRMRTHFTHVLQENMMVLESTRNSANRLVNRILDTARQNITEEQVTNYSAKGRMQAYKSSTLSLSLDQSL